MTNHQPQSIPMALVDELRDQAWRLVEEADREEATRRQQIADLSPRAEMYPDGRQYAYEGDDPVGFITALMGEYGFTPNQLNVTVDCPPGLLDTLANRWPLGT